MPKYQKYLQNTIEVNKEITLEVTEPQTIVKSMNNENLKNLARLSLNKIYNNVIFNGKNK